MMFGASRSRRTRTNRHAASDTRIEEELPPRLIPSLRQLVSTAFGLGHTRLALAGLELEEEIQRLIGAALLAFVILVLVALALVVLTFTIVFAMPEQYRIATMCAITVLYLVIAAGLGLRLRSVFALRPPIFGATLAELDKDREALEQMTRAAHRAPERAADSVSPTSAPRRAERS